MIGLIEATINWTAVGIICSVVIAGIGGLYIAIRNMKSDVRLDLNNAIDIVNNKLDQVGDHLNVQDSKMEDTRTRLARLEGRIRGMLGGNNAPDREGE